MAECREKNSKTAGRTRLVWKAAGWKTIKSKQKQRGADGNIIKMHQSSQCVWVNIALIESSGQTDYNSTRDEKKKQEKKQLSAMPHTKAEMITVHRKTTRPCFLSHLLSSSPSLLPLFYTPNSMSPSNNNSDTTAIVWVSHFVIFRSWLSIWPRFLYFLTTSLQKLHLSLSHSLSLPVFSPFSALQAQPQLISAPFPPIQHQLPLWDHFPRSFDIRDSRARPALRPLCMWRPQTKSRISSFCCHSEIREPAFHRPGVDKANSGQRWWQHQEIKSRGSRKNLVLFCHPQHSRLPD